MPSLLERASIIPGRSLTRSKKIFGRFASHARGCTIVDTEGREYIDMLCGLGAISLGYGPTRFPNLVGVCSLPYDDETQAAEVVLKYVTQWASWVRFTKTGSESCTAAFRIARAATGRKDVIRYFDSYHGWHGWPDEQCVMGNIGEIPMGAHYAAVFVEPSRFKPTDVEWLKRLRSYCNETDTLLVFDSMVVGGRWHIGGASGYYGVQPDLECFGKAYGNGAAVAFVVGGPLTYEHAEIASGTYSGELSGLNAVIGTVDLYLSQPVLQTMWARGQQLIDGLKRVIPPYVGEVQSAVPALLHVEFKDPIHASVFSESMLERGVIWHPLPAFTMYAHTRESIDAVIEAARQSIEVLDEGRYKLGCS